MSVSLSQADVVSKRLNESSLFWYGSFLPLCCKEIRVSPKVRVFPAATLSQILYLTWSGLRSVVTRSVVMRLIVTRGVVVRPNAARSVGIRPIVTGSVVVQPSATHGVVCGLL